MLSKNSILVPILTIGVVLSILLLSRQPSPNSVTAFGSELAGGTPTATPTPTSTPTPTATPVPSPVRIVMPAIKVDAPMSEVSVAPDGMVEAPRGPDEVAWSNGGARPGTIGNAILSGHYDWSTPTPRGAVFFRLRELKKGDKATIYLANGSTLNYEVISSTLYLASTAPSEQILAPTSDEIITMITCEGTYYKDIRDYSHRRVVVARRMR